MEHGLEKGLGLFFSYEGEEHFAEQVDLLEQDLFASTECLETLIKHLIFKYLQEYNKQGQIEDVFGKLLEVVDE
ncbi:hypothetical protein [Pseudoalteromonas phage PH357]|nr:hypothetical protein [Pseudoalteromonas phage PH357]